MNPCKSDGRHSIPQCCAREFLLPARARPRPRKPSFLNGRNLVGNVGSAAPDHALDFRWHYRTQWKKKKKHCGFNHKSKLLTEPTETCCTLWLQAMYAFLGQEITIDRYGELKSSFQVIVIEVVLTGRTMETTMSASSKRDKQTKPLSREGMRRKCNLSFLPEAGWGLRFYPRCINVLQQCSLCIFL